MPEDGGVVDRVLPRRAAARKATKLAAEQLESSPIQPPREEGPTFGEPSPGKGRVKYTYKGKSRHSPTKVRSPVRQGSPTPARVRKPAALRPTPAQNGKRAKPSTSALPLRPRSPTNADSLTSFSLSSDSELGGLDAVVGNRLAYSSPPRKIISREKQPWRPAVRARHFNVGAGSGKRKRVAPAPNSTAPPLPSELEHEAEPHDHPEPSMPSQGHLRNLSSSVHDGSPPRRRLAAPHTPSRGGGAASERRLSNSPPSPDFDGDLTPLSSPEPDEHPNPPLEARSASRPPRSMLGRDIVSRSPLSRRKPRSSALRLSPVEYLQLDEDVGSNAGTSTNWDLDNLGSYVWVKIDTAGDVVEDDIEDVSLDMLWWPAKLIDASIPVRVLLFGDSPAGNEALVDILSPTSSNICSMAVDGRVRFTENTYRIPHRVVDMQDSPNKRPRLNSDDRWTAARGLMLKADEDDNDGLPMMLSAYMDSGPSRSRGRVATSKPLNGISSDKSKGKGKGKALPSPEPTPKLWRAPSCDILYEIPGELVLAKEKKATNDFWPAKLVEYIKPKDERQKPRYRVAFYDGSVKSLTTDMFFTLSDKGFKTCQLGQDSLNYGLDEDPDADEGEDEGGIDFEREFDDVDALRVPSPPPMLPAPVTFEFESLELQFMYVTPVLAAVVAGEYAPANARHDAFMRGAAARHKVCNSAPVRGLLQRENEELLRLVRRWARRRDRREELGITVQQPAVKESGGAPDPAESLAQVGDKAVSTYDHLDVVEDDITIPGSPNTELAVSEAECPPSSFVVPTEPDEDHNLDSTSPSAIVGTHAVREQNDPAHDPDLPERLSPAPSEDVEMAAPLADGDELSSDGVERPRPSMTFRDLLPIDKITYCTSVLLREAVLQLLLWRSGTRTTPQLLPPAEERRLHAIATQKSEETWWVQEIVFMKRAAEGKMLPPGDPKNTPAPSGGSRLRRRNGQ